MSDTSYLWTPPAQQSLTIIGQSKHFPVNRIFCVGRNYHAHAAEMGKSVDKGVDRPFYFTKSPQTLTHSGATVAYPSETKNYHFEMELVMAIHKPGFRVKEADAHKLIYGYACGLDMTRRDLQQAAKDAGKPWDFSKDFEESAICSDLVAMPEVVIENAGIQLSVNGQIKQNSNVNKLIWNIREIIADLTMFYQLEPGDLIYTGTPEGVGAVLPGDKITGMVEGVGEISLNISNPK